MSYNALGAYWVTMAISVILLVAPQPADAVPRLVVFPGASHSVFAPGVSGVRIFYRTHFARDGAQAHPVFYEDGHGHRVRVATVLRSMGVRWSAGGRRVFLQDNRGSDVSDCEVLSRPATGIRGVSLYRIIERAPRHPSGWEKPSESHYYVHCDHWLSSDRVIGAVSGYTDSSPSHEFDYRFIYDARTRHIRWAR